MKVLILCTLIAASQAVQLLGGASEQYRSQDGLGNYAFGYNEGHATGSTFRRESGTGTGLVTGSYGINDADGRARVVNYVADAAGFRANIQTNEPGVEPKDPAATTINKGGLLSAPAGHPLSYAHAPLHNNLAYGPAHHNLAYGPAHHNLAYAAPHHYAAPHYAAGHPGGAFAYNSAVGHHGLGHGYYF